jgi:hypothetical protein
MSPEVAGYLPITLGAGAVIVGGIISVVKGYRWLITEIRAAITEALDHHTEVEAGWQREIERRLDAIESKVDRLAERDGNGK